MPILQSDLFTQGDPTAVTKLENCATGTPSEMASHFNQKTNAGGEHIKKVQQALKNIQAAHPEYLIPSFNVNSSYDDDFAKAVKAYKTAKDIRNYANQIDDIIGIKTVISLDGENSSGPTPPPAEVGSTTWNFSIFLDRPLVGDDTFKLRIISADPGFTDGQDFLIAPDFGGITGDLGSFQCNGFGRFTTPRKVVANEFSAAASRMMLAKLMLTDVINGHMTLGTIGPIERQISVFLPLQNMKDQSLGTSAKSGIFEMRGQLRAASAGQLALKWTSRQSRNSKRSSRQPV